MGTTGSEEGAAVRGIEPGVEDALLVVDVQNDFLPGGSLAVAEGDQILPVINSLVERFAAAGLPVVATRDWHPPDHSSFVTQGGPWPPHCVIGTHGAEFSADLRLPADTPVVSKGTGREDVSYSNFAATNLDEVLRERGVRRVFLVGLATDYCVGTTAEEALARGYQVVLVPAGMRAVSPEQGDAMLRRLVSAGAGITAAGLG
jgi:nicotinamidase/pyrazinamidase